MDDVRTAYLAGAEAAVRTVDLPEIGASWGEPSSLPMMTIGDLAAHLTRSLTLVQAALAADPPDSQRPQIDAGAYFGALRALTEPDSDVNAGIRQRAHDESATGPDAVRARTRTAWAWLQDQLPPTPSTRRVTVFGGDVMTIDEFLRTRCVELAVHLDDLGHTAPPHTVAVAGQALFDAVQFRHGGLAVVRALARADRAEPQVLRVF